jgi:2-polyprenyl-3-methyl-5-hydroxy-6-metoxy-1,4-benzoquinol methylase
MSKRASEPILRKHQPTSADATSTRDTEYADRLQGLQTVWWKRILPVQAPYRWNLRRLHLGLVLDIGCGVGRNLENLGGRAVGVDHNPKSVEFARQSGYTAYTADEFPTSAYARPGTFDSLLLAHVLEHMSEPDAIALVREYLPFVRDGGNVVLITPQERGFRSDPSHVEFMDDVRLARIASALDLRVARRYSFPFPRSFGKLFVYNEFVVVAQLPAGA